MGSTYQIKERLLDHFGARISTYFPSGAIQHEVIWTGNIFENLRSEVAQGNLEAIDIAVSLIETDPMWLPFGKLIKSDLARALKKSNRQITPDSRGKIIAVTAKLLKAEHSPRELEDYAKLVKKFPRDEYKELVSSITPLCEKAHAIKKYLYENL